MEYLIVSFVQFILACFLINAALKHFIKHNDIEADRILTEFLGSLNEDEQGLVATLVEVYEQDPLYNEMDYDEQVRFVKSTYKEMMSQGAPALAVDVAVRNEYNLPI